MYLLGFVRRDSTLDQFVVLHDLSQLIVERHDDQEDLCLGMCLLDVFLEKVVEICDCFFRFFREFE